MANKHKSLGSLFADTAEKIRSKTGGTAKIIADDFPDEIGKIVTLADGTKDATATAADIAEGRTAYVNGQKITGTLDAEGGSGVLESVNITPTGQQIYVVPEGGVDGFNLVTVDGDYNLTPENIAEGIIIYGVEGTLKIGASSTIPSEYESFVEHAKLLYTGDYANIAIVESNNILNVAFLMDDFKVLSYNESTTEFTAIGWLYCEYTKASQTWRVVNYTMEASTGTNYVKHIRYSSVHWEYGGQVIWPVGAGGGGGIAPNERVYQVGTAAEELTIAYETSATGAIG